MLAPCSDRQYNVPAICHPLDTVLCAGSGKRSVPVLDSQLLVHCILHILFCRQYAPMCICPHVHGDIGLVRKSAVLVAMKVAINAF